MNDRRVTVNNQDEDPSLNAENNDAGVDVSNSNEDLKKALEEAQTKSEENWNLFLRTRADMDNLRRRAELDLDNARKYGVERFAREMLSVIDSLEHGLAIAESEHDAAYRAGMALTLKLCLDIFEKFGIVEINPLGENFDPNKHEAISMQVNSEVEPNKILIVAQKGFILNERVLRPARVIVSKAEE